MFVCTELLVYEIALVCQGRGTRQLLFERGRAWESGACEGRGVGKLLLAEGQVWEIYCL